MSGRTLARLATGEVVVLDIPADGHSHAISSDSELSVEASLAGAPAARPPPAVHVPPPGPPQASLGGFERHIWNGCFVCVIYLPRNMVRCEETIADVVAHGFPRPYMIPGVSPRPGDTVHDCVCRAHHNAVRFFLEQGLDAHYHLMVLEDDARFRFDESESMLSVALGQLEAWGKWGCLHVGHIAMGPIYPVGVHGLCRSTNPCTSHCYILNRSRIRRVFARVPERLWKRPYMVEGCWAFPADERFAMAPPLSTQCVMPKEMAAMPIVRDVFTFQDGEYFSMGFGLAQTVLGITLVAWALVEATRWPLRSARAAELAADGDDVAPCAAESPSVHGQLGGWLLANAVLVHLVAYLAQRYTCSWRERRTWSTWLLDGSKVALGLGAAQLIDYCVVLYNERGGGRTPYWPADVGDDDADGLSRMAAMLILVPLVAQPTALALRIVLSLAGTRVRALKSIAVPGRYADPLGLPLPPPATGPAESRQRSFSGHSQAASDVAVFIPGEGLASTAPPRGPAPAPSRPPSLAAVALRATEPERLQALPARPSWWLAQAFVWVACVCAGTAFAYLLLHGLEQLLEERAPTVSLAIALTSLPWRCSFKEWIICGLGRLLITVAAFEIADYVNACPAFRPGRPRGARSRRDAALLLAGQERLIEEAEADELAGVGLEVDDPGSALGTMAPPTGQATPQRSGRARGPPPML